jgi:L-alanine-DL-glutamate epimerase-like enolase superfamily enzyme
MMPHTKNAEETVPMRIRSVTPFWVSLPLAKPLKLANHVIATADNLLVRIEDSDGVVGWGEASSAPTMTGETPEGMMAAVKYMQPRLEGLEVEDLAGFGQTVDGFMYGNAAAKSALDMAVYDLEGKRRKVPVVELLGGAIRRQMPVLWMLAANELKADTAAAERMAAEGFVAYKVKFGSSTPEADLERAAAARRVLGADAHISGDANQGYSREQALRVARGAVAAGLSFIEQPVAYHDLDGMAAVAAATSVPIGTDEGVHSLEDIEKHHAHKAARGASLKTIKLGGLTAVMQAGRRMQALGMHVNLAGKIADSSVASAAIVHLGAALPQLDWDVSVTCQYLAQDIAREPLRIERGHARVPDRPGLGIEVDESRLSGLAGQRLAA